MSLLIRAARNGDAALILAFIRELAEYENLAHEIVADEAMMHEALFGEHPRVFGDIVEWNGEPAGCAVWFYNFSTFHGRCGIYSKTCSCAPPSAARGLAGRCSPASRSAASRRS
jgi:hypothetical protein